MLVLRSAQFDAFRDSSMGDFELRTVADLRSSFPEKLAPNSDEDLRTLIRYGLERSRVYGVINEDDVTRYFEYMVEYGADFDTAPGTWWAAPILTSPQKTGYEKMNELDDLTTFDLRRAPHESSGEKANRL